MSVNYHQDSLHQQSEPGNSHHDPLLQSHSSPAPATYPYPPPPPQQSYDAPPGQNGGPMQPAAGPGNGQQKGNRLRKACDSCSVRKVKCDEANPCRACEALDIPCTFDRPSRRRGPPNKHAEAIKRRRIESPGEFESPSSPSNVAATLASFSVHAVISAESICPFNTLELLIDDFFTYIHPLAPFPHEPSFRAAFRAREDQHNPSFLALLASMVGLLVASFPRKPRLHLKAQHREHLFPNSISLVERCHKVAIESRGAGYLDKELTVYDAATSYFLGVAAGYTFDWKHCRLYLGECLSISRSLGLHKATESVPAGLSSNGSGYEGQLDEPVDYIRQEIGRRIFWTIFVGVRSMHQLGASIGELVMAPPTRSVPYPPLPLEVDDKHIFVSHIEHQESGVISKITGFNLGVKIYSTLTPLVTFELAYGVDEVIDWNRQRRVLEECLRAVKKALEDAPPELLLTPGSEPGDFATTRQYFPPVPEYPGMRGAAGRPVVPQAPMTDDQRTLAYEIQKANIYASQLGTRSYLVEKYWNLRDQYQMRATSASPSANSSPGAVAAVLEGPSSTFDIIDAEMNAERENSVKDLLQVLNSISQVNMEPNGGSFINKIRQIASTLLDTPRNRKGPLALKAEEYLGRFLDILMKLERVTPGPSGGGFEAENEEEELRHWADLRENQTRFAQAGGFVSQT